MRSQAAWALGEIEDAKAVEGFVGALAKDTDAHVRKQAAWALGEIRDPRASGPLASALKETSAEVRKQGGLGPGRDEGVRMPLSDQPLLRAEAAVSVIMDFLYQSGRASAAEVLAGSSRPSELFRGARDAAHPRVQGPRAPPAGNNMPNEYRT